MLMSKSLTNSGDIPMQKWILFISLFVVAVFSRHSGFAESPRPVVIFETTQGNFEVTLFPDVAPVAVDNFLSLVKKGYYNGTIFHRVIKKFMVQGGDPLGNGTGGQSIWGKPFEDEVNPQVKFSKPGILAMANKGPNTNGSQFFITTAATPWLNQKHTIFGEVTKGYDVVEKIEATKTGAQDRPLETQEIIRITLKS